MSKLVLTLYRQLLKFGIQRKVRDNQFYLPILQGALRTGRRSSNDWNPRSDQLLQFQLWSDTVGSEYYGKGARKFDNNMETLLGAIVPRGLLKAPEFTPARLQYMSFLADNDLLYGVRNSDGLRDVVRHCFRDKEISVAISKRIDVAFHSLKTLNLMRSDLEKAYDEHVLHSDAKLLEHRRFKIGDVVSHKTELWRGVVRRWTIDEQRKMQRCVIVVGSQDDDDAAAGADGTMEPCELYDASDLELVENPQLRRIDKNCSHFGLHFDSASNSYIPSDFLRYRFPRDSNGGDDAAAAAARAKQRQVLQGAAERVAAAASQVVGELVQLCAKYGVEVGSDDCPGDEEGKILREVLLYELTLLKRLQQQLRQQLRSGPPSISARDPGAAAEMLSQLVASVETVLQARFQGSGVTYFEGLLLPRVGDQLAASRARPALTEDEAAMALPRALFKPGDAVVHKRHGFRCVVIGFDQRPVLSTSEAYEAYNAAADRMEQPHYSCCIADSRAVDGSREGSAARVVYVPQEDLALDRQPAYGGAPLGPLEQVYFSSYDSASGRHVPKQRLQFCFAGSAATGAEERAYDVAERLLLEALSLLRRAVNSSRERHHAHIAPGTFTEDLATGGIDVRDLLMILRLSDDSHDTYGVERMASLTLLTHSSVAVNKLMRLGSSLAPRSRARALEAFRRAREIDPLYAEAPNKIAHLLYLDGNYEQAVSHAKIAIALCPDHISAIGLLGMSLDKLNRLPEARSAFRRGLELHPWSHDLSSKLFTAERRVEQQGQQCGGTAAVAYGTGEGGHKTLQDKQ